MISLGKGQCGENSHCANSLKVVYISSLEEWIPLDSCRKNRGADAVGWFSHFRIVTVIKTHHVQSDGMDSFY